MWATLAVLLHFVCCTFDKTRRLTVNAGNNLIPSPFLQDIVV